MSMAQFLQLVSPEPNTGCWIWLGPIAKTTGYGRVSIDGLNGYAHRVAVEVSGRTIPPGFSVDHLCRNRWCANPSHLEAVTPAENNRRASLTRTNWARGERQGGTDLSAAQVLAIREVYSSGGISQRALGAQFGISQASVSLITSGNRWAHVGGMS